MGNWLCDCDSLIRPNDLMSHVTKLSSQAGNPAFGRFTSAEDGPSPFGSNTLKLRSITLKEQHLKGATPLGSNTLGHQGATPA